MAKTAAELKNAYAKKAYDDIRLQVKKGQKEKIRARAESLGMSLQGYINHLIDEDMKEAGQQPE
ncbi:antitoxin [Anaerotruncus massiliensis (ex Liu et al. 2021)]|uniref:antitoxin n=1 Tax=Anaerotruncus massiliensis (ex Liu et al. 2021) TaxID=2321404 RepID=UPI003AB32050